jgi:hypothetical protein
MVADQRHLAVATDLDSNDVRVATDRTIFDVALITTCGDIDWHDDFLSTLIANVSGFIIHIGIRLLTANQEIWSFGFRFGDLQ